MEVGEGSLTVSGHGRDDEDLLRRFRTGDLAACQQLARWASDMVRFKDFYVPPSDLEDLVQDTLADVWRVVSDPGFKLRDSLRGLVRKVAAARCIDRLRRRRPILDLDLDLVDPRQNPHERAEGRNARLLLRWVLRSLGENCKQIIALRFYEGLSYAEIASRLGRSEATMRVRMFNCMKEIRRFIERCEDPFLANSVRGSRSSATDRPTAPVPKQTWVED